jgi:hypothetical protein
MRFFYPAVQANNLGEEDTRPGQHRLCVQSSKRPFSSWAGSVIERTRDQYNRNRPMAARVTRAKDTLGFFTYRLQPLPTTQRTAITDSFRGQCPAVADY